jgi:hypothetical protein
LLYRIVTTFIMLRNAILLLIPAYFVAKTLHDNPMLFGMSVGDDKLPSRDVFPIYTSHPILDTVLQQHKSQLGDDYESYRNHCLRVLTFATWYLKESSEYQKVLEEGAVPAHAMNVMALALAYHDIGLWTDGALNYLAPSVSVMNKDMENQLEEEESDGPLPPFSDADLETARAIILEHHKFRHWDKPAESVVDSALVNAVRRGDWADATMGFVKSGMPPSHLEAAYKAIPGAGFHKMLARMGGRLSPDSIPGQLEMLRIFKW